MTSRETERKTSGSLELLGFQQRYRGGFCDDLLSERLEKLKSVVVKVTVDLGDAAVLDDPELAAGITDQPLIVANNHNACRETEISTAIAQVSQYNNQLISLKYNNTIGSDFDFKEINTQFR